MLQSLGSQRVGHDLVTEEQLEKTVVEVTKKLKYRTTIWSSTPLLEIYSKEMK